MTRVPSVQLHTATCFYACHKSASNLTFFIDFGLCVGIPRYTPNKAAISFEVCTVNKYIPLHHFFKTTLFTQCWRSYEEHKFLIVFKYAVGFPIMILYSRLNLFVFFMACSNPFVFNGHSVILRCCYFYFRKHQFIFTFQ